MRFLHISDLHFGKTVHGVSMLENGDQGFWVDRFLEKTAELKPDAVLIAGDVYDRSSPSGEAVTLLSRLLTSLADLSVPVMMVAGNHDSSPKLSFVRDLLGRQRLYISAPLEGSPDLARVTLEDDFGPVDFWLMPYVFPALAARALNADSDAFGFPDNETAVRALLGRQKIDLTRRNVLVAHQYVTAGGFEGMRGGSESAVGGVGQVDVSAFDAFDYVALGHIHAAYSVGRESVRYAGSPLCYDFNELRQPEKGPLLVELGGKRDGGPAPIRWETVVIPPLHPMRVLRGTFAELRDAELANPRTGEYLKLILTDRRLTPETASFFESLFTERGSVLMDRASEYSPFGNGSDASEPHAARQRSVEELFAEFWSRSSGGDGPSERDFALLSRAGEITRRSDAKGEPTQDDILAILDFLTEEGDA